MLKTNLSEETYTEFVNSLEANHFLHSVNWANFRETIAWSHDIVGYYEQDELVAAAVILYKKVSKTPFKIAYTPRGFVTRDTSNIKGFISELKPYLKKQKVISYKVDPDCTLQQLDTKLEPLSEERNLELHNELLANDFKHLGYVNNFEGMNPRHTIRINTKDTNIDAVLANMEKKTRNACKIGEKKGLIIEHVGVEKLDVFMDLLTQTAERDGFGFRHQKYYEDMFKYFGEDLHLNLAKIDASSMIANLETEIAKLQKEEEKLNTILAGDNLSDKNRKKSTNKLDEVTSRIKKHEKSISELAEEAKINPDGTYVAGSMYIVDGDKAWYIYGASGNKFREMMPAYGLVRDMLTTACEENYKYFDLFGISGEYNPDNELFGLFSFKKGFGGDVIEFIGEYDLAINKPMTIAFEKGYPLIKKIRKMKK